MCKDQRLFQSEPTYRFKRTQCLTKAHFGIPKHFAWNREVRHCFLYGVYLFFAKNDFNSFVRIYWAINNASSLLNGSNSFDNNIKSFGCYIKPFIRLLFSEFWKVMPRISTIKQYQMNIIVEETQVIVILVNKVGYLHIQQIVVHPCSQRFFSDTFIGCIAQ